jgi:photosystem II stability/assembly factor-like uncharacterized protein
MPCVDALKAKPLPGGRGWRRALALCCLASSPLLASAAEAPARPKMLDRPAEVRPHAERQLLLGGAWAGHRVVAVGAAGTVVLSDDEGRNWRQASAVPTSATLTAVAFANERDGYAIGHMGVVLRSRDGGDTWVRVLDGTQAAALNLAAAEALVTKDDSAAHKLLHKLARLAVTDGPNKPLLVLQVDRPEHALVLGAYGLALETSDGGANWRAAIDRFDNTKGLHYYGMAGRQGDGVVVGEQGLLLRAAEGGAYKETTSPYSGTLFGVLAAKAGHLVAYGLRGTVLRSADNGASWTRVDAKATTSYQSGAVLADGTLVLGNEIGVLAASPDGGQSFQLLPQRVQPAAGLLPLSGRQLLVLGPKGAERVELKAQQDNQ